MSEIIIPAPGTFKDRGIGLIIFGILTIILGVIVGSFVPLIFVGNSLNAANGSGSPGMSSLVPAISMYGVLAIANIWLGIGSIMKRRWARALLLIAAWSWLLLGVVMVVFMAVGMPTFLRAAQAGKADFTPGIQSTVMAVTLGFFVVFFVILPAIYVFFYRSKHVKATCDSCDPVRRWTDACPLPVLAMALWMAMGTLSLVAMALGGPAVLPIFGIIMTGLPARLVCLILALVWLCTAWGIFRLDLRAWWLLVGLLVIYMISSLITFNIHSMAEIYAAMHLASKDLSLLQDSSFMKVYTIAGPIGVTVLTLGYLAYIRKFFIKTRALPSSL